MTIRERFEQLELERLSPWATCSRNSKGRAKEEQECDIRTVFQRDRDRILHCKSFRRLKDKTQVFLSPQGDHYRTRLTHTLEVSQIGRTVAKALGLNEDLVEAIALGHDLGHTPFGHAGERALNEICYEGFDHSKQSLRIVDLLEREGRGLNLTMEVRDGILNHQIAKHPATLEGQIVRICDKLAYLHHDMDDAIRAGIISEKSIPDYLRKDLGKSARERLNTLIHDMVEESTGQKEIRMSDTRVQYMRDLRDLMYRMVYHNPAAKNQDENAMRMIRELYRYFLHHTEALPREYVERLFMGDSAERVICDYISGMTDQYSIHCFENIFVPRSWPV